MGLLQAIRRSLFLKTYLEVGEVLQDPGMVDSALSVRDSHSVQELGKVTVKRKLCVFARDLELAQWVDRSVHGPRFAHHRIEDGTCPQNLVDAYRANARPLTLTV